MFIMLLRLYFGFLLFHGIWTRSIQNTTADYKSLMTAILKLEERIDNITNVFEQDLTEKVKPVLFFVRLSTSTTLNKNSIVKFNEVGINEGNHFNPGDGIFVAPVSGVYQFSWTTITDASNIAETELRVDNVVKDTLHIYLSSSEYIQSGTKVVFCKVKKGDHVWIQTTKNYESNLFREVNSVAKSTFTGMLVHTL